MEQMSKQQLSKAPFTLDDLCRFIDGSMPKFLIEHEEGSDNERKWLGNNYSQKDEAEIRSQLRQPLSVPVIKTKLTNISGEQRRRRTSFKIEAAADPNDEVKAELAGLQVKAVERRSDFKWMESEVFDSGMVKYGVSKMKLQTIDYYKRVVVEGLDYKCFIWDRNSKKYNINDDALWCCEIEKVPRKFLEELENIDTTYISEGEHNNFRGRETTSYYVTRSSNATNDYDMLSVFHFYIKQPRKVYCVVFEDSQNLFSENLIIEKFSTKKEAERKLREYQVEYVLQGFEPEGSVEVKTELKLDYYKFCYNVVLKYEETELEMFPYDVFRTIHFEGQYVSMMDFLKDPQKIIDRMWMQIDFSIGKSLKNVYLMVEELLAASNPPEKARQIINKTGGVIGVKSLREDVLKEITSAGANPQWFQVIDLMLGYLEDLAGGVNFQGGAIGSTQSGKSQQILANEGQKLAVPLFDNLSRWKMGVGRNIISWLQHYEDAEDVIRVNGGALSQEMLMLLQEKGIYTPSEFKKDGTGYLRVNQEGNQLSYLKDANFELHVSEAELSETDKQMKYSMYESAQEKDPLLLQSPTFQEKKLELLGLPRAETMMIIQERRDAAEQAAKMAEEELNLRKAEILVQDKGQMLGQLNSNKSLESKKEEKPKKKEKAK